MFMVKKIDKKAVGQRIKEIRLKKGMTLEEFGGLFNAGKGLVSRWENGLSTPTPDRLKQIAKVGDRTLEELLYGNRFFYLFDRINERLPKEKKYLTGRIPAPIVFDISTELDRYGISLSDMEAVDTIIDNSMEKIDKDFDDTTMRFVQTIKDNWDIAPKIYNRMVSEWELFKKRFKELSEFRDLIYCDDKNVYSDNDNIIEGYYHCLEAVINEELAFREVHFHSVKLDDFDKDKQITDYGEKGFFYSFVDHTKKPIQEYETALGVYSPKDQSLYVSAWYKNRFANLHFMRKYFVIYNKEVYITELLEDCTFLIDNQKISYEDVYYFAPLLAVLY